MKQYKVHSNAARYPMLGETELQELADDIKANGQRLPIIINKDDLIVDGRNRLAACEIAGVEPKFELFDGGDEINFILSMNINRRHLSKGQRAMAVAIAYPEAGHKSRPVLKIRDEKVDKSYLSMARAVLKQLPDQVDAILAGNVPLADVFKDIEEQKLALEDLQKRIFRLRRTHPALADRVTNDEILIDEAEKLIFPKRKKEGITDEELLALNVTGAYSKLSEEMSEIDRFITRLSEPHIGSIVEVLMRIVDMARTSSVELSKRCGKSSHLTDVTGKKS